MMKSVKEIQEAIEEKEKAVSEIRKVLGADCLTHEAENRVEAMRRLWNCCEFAYTIEDFKQNVQEDDADENVKSLMKRFMRHALGMKEE